VRPAARRRQCTAWRCRRRQTPCWRSRRTTATTSSATWPPSASAPSPARCPGPTMRPQPPRPPLKQRAERALHGLSLGRRRLCGAAASAGVWSAPANWGAGGRARAPAAPERAAARAAGEAGVVDRPGGRHFDQRLHHLLLGAHPAQPGPAPARPRRPRARALRGRGLHRPPLSLPCSRRRPEERRRRRQGTPECAGRSMQVDKIVGASAPEDTLSALEALATAHHERARPAAALRCAMRC
jgi:hypothetical protein